MQLIKSVIPTQVLKWTVVLTDVASLRQLESENNKQHLIPDFYTDSLSRLFTCLTTAIVDESET